ncbi:MAG: agmatine deiminase family protein [Rhizobiaceae bacterium]
MDQSAPTPRDLGFAMPGEFSPHLRTWMMWPCRASVWPDMMGTCRNYADVAHAIRQYEPVTMAVRPQDIAQARSMLGSDIELAEIDMDDSWARDAGPNFIVDGKGNRAAALFQFNAWGGKYSPFDKDGRFSGEVASIAGTATFSSKLVAEGGGITVDGEGTLITTQSCFPNANRNPHWNQQTISDELEAMLGVKKVIWLPGNPLEDETDGHVDGIAVFARPGLIVAEEIEDPDDPWHEISLRNLAALAGQTDASGRELKIVTMPAADAKCATSDRFCLSYVNFYICNGGVIAPKYGLPSDYRAREILQGLFPDRTISMVNILDIAGGGGGIHCITQQEPA